MSARKFFTRVAIVCIAVVLLIAVLFPLLSQAVASAANHGQRGYVIPKGYFVESDSAPAFPPYMGAGDCYADGTSTDTYPGRVPGFCMAPNQVVYRHVWVGNGGGSPDAIFSGGNPVSGGDNAHKEDGEGGCKNKNSGKDGTPGECNAGGGQEKKDQ